MEHIGKNVYICEFVGRRINFNPNTFSLCHEFQVGDQVLGNIEDFSYENYCNGLNKVIENNFNENAPCRKCTKCENRLFNKQMLQYITVNTSCYCNSSCIYCQAHNGEEGSGYNPIPYFEILREEDSLGKDCYFDWGVANLH